MEGDCQLSTYTIYTDLEMVQEFESSFRLRKGDEIVHVHAAEKKIYWTVHMCSNNRVWKDTTR
jgi:hypothetical protein